MTGEHPSVQRRAAVDADSEGVGPPYIFQVSFPAYVLALAPLALVFALAYALEVGIIHPTRSDELWAIHSRRAIDTGSAELLDDSTVVSLRRTMCFGWCPSYSLKVFGSGRVEYVGKRFVCAYGPREGKADPREVSRLVKAMIAAGYFGYSWREGNFATDNPTAVTSLQHQGQSFEISHYYGDQGAPKWLRAMEDEIDRVAATAQWLPSHDKDWRAQCPTVDGGLRNLTMDELVSR